MLTENLQPRRITRENSQKKRLEKWSKENWFFHHDNTSTHLALSIRELSADKKKITCDLARSVFS